ncbi:MAG: formimidoylglutamate deiminase [Alphaproteobacteria bacterium]|nr:MAG: formimidoylglutamate deiminase [Alphaproteobacteria bacterium]
MKHYFFEKAYLTSRWSQDVLIGVDDSGFISSIETDVSDHGREKTRGFALSAIPNTHSHAFQKILAGRTEYRNSTQNNTRDNFWTWRDLMYQFANAVTPEDVKNIAAFLYLEMLKAGYGSVAEFHYLHHQPGGRPYDDPAEMSYAIAAAAQDVGIGLTHLPVLYMQGGFGNVPLVERQYRFKQDVEGYLKLLDQLRRTMPAHQNLGVAFHSLRAVPQGSMAEVLAGIDRKMPVHIHIAEQVKEVEACLEYTGQRPVEWLLSHHNVDKNWCLVHATHMMDGEISALAKSGATASICTTTEANLGDGFFPLKKYLDKGGKISIGSDGNSMINPLEEIRWLEYGARLCEQKRNIAASQNNPHTGSALYDAIQKGGAQALGQKTGTIEVGRRADIMVLDGADILLNQVPEKNILDAAIFSCQHNIVKHVMVAGNWCIQDRQHHAQEEITAGYMKTVTRLRSLI